jgi:hypothetical protein
VCRESVLERAAPVHMIASPMRFPAGDVMAQPGMKNAPLSGAFSSSICVEPTTRLELVTC